MSSSSSHTAVHFGAGNIGRGFIGPLLVEAGYSVIFADVDKEIIAAIHEDNHYDVHLLDEKEVGKPVKDISVTDVDGILSTSPELIDKIADDADIITTAVGPNILARIAPTIAKGLTRRAEKGNTNSLNIIACENMVNATDKLQQHVLENLPTDTTHKVHQYIRDHVGFANCSVDRIVPPQSSASSSDDGQGVDLDVFVEVYHEWVIEETSLQPLPLSIPGAKFKPDLSPYIERKLFTLNTGHALTAYLGYLKEPTTTIDVAVLDPEIHKIVLGAMSESGAALQKKHGFTKKEHDKYIQQIITRFKNANLKDDVVRVGRSPLRKLSEGDRILGPLLLCRKYELPVDNLLIGVAAALRYDNPDDEESVELQKKIKETGLEAYVEKIVGKDDGEKVLKAYKGFES